MRYRTARARAYLALFVFCTLSPTATAQDAPLTGTLQVYQPDPSSVSSPIYALEVTQGQRLNLTFRHAPPAAITSGARVTVRPTDDGRWDFVEALGPERVVTETAAAADRTIALLLLDFDDSASTCSTGDIASLMFDATQSVDGLFRASSFGAMGFARDANGDGAADVFPLRISASIASNTCDTSSWTTLADAAATAAGVALSPYRHLVYILPPNVSCNWAGLANIGCGSVCRVWIKGNNCLRSDAYVHELGHNLGLFHAGTDVNNDGVLDDEYGDWSCPMGLSNVGWRQFNAPHTDELGWFPQGAMVPIAGGGVYTVSALEQPLNAPQVLRLARPARGDALYVWYRAALGAHSEGLPAGYRNRTSIHAFSGSGFTKLLATLGDGQSFTDAVTGHRITQVSSTSTSALVDVSYQPPTASISIADASMAEGSSGPASLVFSVQLAYAVDFTVTVAYATVDGTATAGSDFVAASGMLTFAPGETQKTIGVTVLGDTSTEIDERFSVRLSQPSSGALLARAEATGTILNDDGSGNVPPVPQFFSSVVSGTAPLSVNFFSSLSYDPDGYVAAYAWEFGDGTTSAMMSPSHTFVSAGTYAVRLSVTDNKGATAGTSQSIVVSGGQSQNRPPVARAVASTLSGVAPLVVDFSGTTSYNPDGGSLSYAWSFGDGTAATTPLASKTYASAGSFTVALTVADAAGASASTTLTVVVTAAPTNQPPVAHASANPTTGKAPLFVTFSSTGSSDPEGGALTFAWTFGDGTTSTSAAPSKTYAIAGTFTATLTVTDVTGRTASDAVTISVQPATPSPGSNEPPVAVAFPHVSGGVAPVTVNCYASPSYDRDGYLVGYAWNFGDGTTSTSMNPSHTFTSAGTYVVGLTVTDNKFATGTTAFTISVLGSGPNHPPVALATATPVTGTAPLPVTFSSVGSSDPDGDPLTFAWSFGDGGTSSTANPSKTYAAAGTYLVTLAVTDNKGAVGTASLTVTVQPSATNEAPTARAAATITSGPIPLTVSLSSAGSFDPEGGALSYAWDFGDGSSSLEQHPTKVFTVAGTYNVRLTVVDAQGLASVATLTITAQSVAQPPGSNQPPTAVAFSNVTSGKAPLQVNFYSSQSFDTDGYVAFYAWDFGDGTSSLGMSPTHVFVGTGPYVVRLTVRDNKGATASTTMTIAVQ